MKKYMLLTVAILFVFTSYAQFKIGAQASFSNTWLLNRNLSDAGDRVDPLASFAPGYGFQFVYVFNEAIGISSGIGLSNYLQKTDGEVFGERYEAETNLSFLEIPILARFENEGGTYFEVGPMFSFLSEAKESFTPESSNGLLGSYSDEVFDDDFNSTMIAAVVGFGILVDLSDNMQLTAGLNLVYGLNDATTEYTEQEAFDLEDQSYYSGVAHIEQDGDFKYENTTIAAGGVKIGIVYVIRGS